MERKELHALVNKAMAEGQYNTKAARAILIEWAELNVELRGMLIFLGADQAMRDLVHVERHVSREARAEDEQDRLLSPQQMDERREAKVQRRLFWDRYALFGHLPLREATRPDLRNSITNRTKQAAGNLACAKFEQKVADRLKNDRTQVKDVLKNDALLKLARACDVI